MTYCRLSEPNYINDGINFSKPVRFGPPRSIFPGTVATGTVIECMPCSLRTQALLCAICGVVGERDSGSGRRGKNERRQAHESSFQSTPQLAVDMSQ
ncbi:unnamed protein product [Boreogadus saida]